MRDVTHLSRVTTRVSHTTYTTPHHTTVSSCVPRATSRSDVRTGDNYIPRPSFRKLTRATRTAGMAC